MFDVAGVGPADLLPFILVGFVAQMIDGALGMAFGVISNTLLISLGVPPAAASAIVHTIKNFTGAVSAASHIVHRNVDWRLFWRLVITGVIGGVLGAYVLTEILPSLAKRLVLAYLAAIGLFLVWRGLTRIHHPEKQPKIVEPLGFAGGFLDAAGGGGWGPIVTSNLLVQGATPRIAVGTVNTAEVFLALAITATFIISIGFSALGVPALGLLIGGLAAAPFGGFVAARVSAKWMLAMVGIVLTATSLYGLYRALS
ncbi:MAG TPA: sulfite exporter TauE/SafE family protein [Allosphingosinicella sp.]|nr:sulfite exporter TauE/SafE family protein [Allosphingosinicella sp.]